MKKRIVFLSLVGLISCIKPELNIADLVSLTKSEVSKEINVNDVSKLSKTKVYKIVRTENDEQKAEKQISDLVKQALKEKKKISIAGAQHSMGGHTLYPDGFVLDMSKFNKISFDPKSEILTVGSGALWDDILAYLDKYNYSIHVMQAYSSFTVGGSISVNCHGWEPDSEPISSSVISFKLVTSNGEIINCSRKENPELFSLVLGGYGLFGVILSVEIKAVPNEVYKFEYKKIDSSKYVEEYSKRINNEIGLAYGRLNVNSKDFLKYSTLNYFIKNKEKNLSSFKLNTNLKPGLERFIFRSTEDNDTAKSLRWFLESNFIQFSVPEFSTRNQQLLVPVSVHKDEDKSKTDLLQEYFIPKEKVSDFISDLQKIIPKYKVDLLNITIRNVKKDNTSFLKYANGEVFGFVLLFSHNIQESEEELKKASQEMTDSVIKLGGTYYLPYRPYQTKEQIKKSYPQISKFFELKKKYDPEEVFNNKFYSFYKDI